MKVSVKRKIRWAFLILLGVVLLTLLVIGIVRAIISEPKEQWITSEVSPNEVYTLELYMVGTPRFPFWVTDCRGYLLRDQVQVGLVEFELYNDGKVATKDNFAVEWQASQVVIHANALKMMEKDFTISYPY